MTPKLSSRLSKLFPRLASDADGEIIATVRAIRAALQSDGLDLHDLAACIAGGEVAPTMRPAQIAGAPCWKSISHQDRVGWMKLVLADSTLGELERDRMNDLAGHLRSGIRFSPNWRRIRLFDERLARLHAQGARP
jgi:hypothetical protein